jgi:hypothetical protein
MIQELNTINESAGMAGNYQQQAGEREDGLMAVGAK